MFVGGTKLHRGEMEKRCRNGAETVQFSRSFDRAGAGLQTKTKRTERAGIGICLAVFAISAIAPSISPETAKGLILLFCYISN